MCYSTYGHARDRLCARMYTRSRSGRMYTHVLSRSGRYMRRLRRLHARQAPPLARRRRCAPLPGSAKALLPDALSIPYARYGLAYRLDWAGLTGLGLTMRRKRPYNTSRQLSAPRLGGGLHYHTETLTRRGRGMVGRGPSAIRRSDERSWSDRFPYPPWSHPPVIGGVALPTSGGLRGACFRPPTG